MALSVLIPTAITTAMLTSSSIPETDYAVWSGATTYAIGDRCISTVTHRIYESAINSNLNNDPTLIANRTGATIKWLDIGPTNRWAMLDDVNNTQSDYASPVTVVLQPGVFNSVYLGNLVASTVQVVVKDAPVGNEVFNSGVISLQEPIPDYYEYFFNPFKSMVNYLVSSIPPYSEAVVTITITNSAGNVKCGILSLGILNQLGRTVLGATAKPKTYSYITTDAFGTTTIVRRKATTDMTASCVVDIGEASSVLAIIQSVLDVPCVWIANDECTLYNGLIIFGLGSGDLVYTDSVKCSLSLTVQGLI
jgi:hypothetical protein